MNYLYETHCHGSQCSRCAKSTTQELVRAYKAAGYAGMVLTDHFIHGNTAVSRRLPWETRMHAYYDAFLEARAVGDELDFDVIFGFEHWYGGGKEILVYGVELDFLLANPDLPELFIEDFARRVRAVGGVLVQAHPYRDRYYIDDSIPIRPDLVDGIEVYNAWNTPGENLPALKLAQERELLCTSGGDVHADWDKMIGAAGILLPHRVKASREFADVLRSKNYAFRVNGRDVWNISEKDL